MYIYSSPIGRLIIESDGEAITVCAFDQNDDKTGVHKEKEPNGLTELPSSNVIKRCVYELESYFAGSLISFTVPLRPKGTAFRMKVWQELQKIGYGETINYKQLAEAVGNPLAARAVGGANHHNPIVILIPCHRVIGASGDLTGYGGGLWRKKYLLDLEKPK